MIKTAFVCPQWLMFPIQALTSTSGLLCLVSDLRLLLDGFSKCWPNWKNREEICFWYWNDRSVYSILCEDIWGDLLFQGGYLPCKSTFQKYPLSIFIPQSNLASNYILPLFFSIFHIWDPKQCMCMHCLSLKTTQFTKIFTRMISNLKYKCLTWQIRSY